jgi:outer membrane protein assembly factor BamB
VVTAHDASDGKELWRVKYDGYSQIPRPVHGHGMIFLSSGYDSPTLMAIRADGGGDGAKGPVVWSNAKNAPHTPSPLLVGDELYTVSDGGFASCFDAKTGKIHWQKRIEDTHYSASPVYADGKVYLQSEEGVATVLRAGTKFEVLAQNTMGERALASYAIADSAIFLRTAGHLYRIQAK